MTNMRGKIALGKGKWQGEDSLEDLIPFLTFYTILHKAGAPLIETDILVTVLVLHIPSKF